QNYIYIEADVEGEYSGKLSFVGRPYFDTIKKEIKLKDFDFSFDSRNTLVKVGDWLLHSSFKDGLNSKIGFNIVDKLFDSKKAIEATLNRKVNDIISCHGKISRIVPTTIIVEKGWIRSVI